ncbi:MAG: alpha/beta fold hydrolase [Anaerolineae bacterium]|nr:alpha/beta fold hydrolase [Anaerolineae bacterium]
MISVGRARAYEGSEITIEQTLAHGSNYERYIASYLSDGLKIYALLTVPRGEKPATGWPVIIFNHGYIAPSVYRTTERYVEYVNRIAQSGYIVFRSDYRGHGSSEGEARGGYGSPDYTTDVLNATASMKKFPDADPDRIGMWGHSMGGYITLRSMVIDPDIKAGVIWAGVVASYADLFAQWRRPTSGGAQVVPPSTSLRRGWRTELVEQYGTPEENPEFWDSISANSYLGELSSPIQLHHGTADTSVPVLFSELLNEQIIAVDGNSELYLYPGDNHNLSQNFGTAMARTIRFFDEHVKGTQ